MSETWTTEYPTKPGYYWIRSHRGGFCYDLGSPDIVEAVSDNSGGLDFYVTGLEIPLDKADTIPAEWFGPIEPPSGNWHRRGVVPVTVCAWCNKSGELLHWTAQGADGFYHCAVVCRECYETALKALAAEQQPEPEQPN